MKPAIIELMPCTTMVMVGARASAITFPTPVIATLFSFIAEPSLAAASDAFSPKPPPMPYSPVTRLSSSIPALPWERKGISARPARPNRAMASAALIPTSVCFWKPSMTVPRASMGSCAFLMSTPRLASVPASFLLPPSAAPIDFTNFSTPVIPASALTPDITKAALSCWTCGTDIPTIWAVCSVFSPASPIFSAKWITASTANAAIISSPNPESISRMALTCSAASLTETAVSRAAAADSWNATTEEAPIAFIPAPRAATDSAMD